MTPPWLFVYGTLRAGSAHPMARWLARHARYGGRARAPARLFRIRRYPGAIAAVRPGDEVVGDLYRVRGAAAWRRLDRYEGCDGARPPPHEFVRCTALVTAARGQRRIAAAVYLYRGRLPRWRRIASGDWFRP